MKIKTPRHIMELHECSRVEKESEKTILKHYEFYYRPRQGERAFVDHVLAPDLFTAISRFKATGPNMEILKIKILKGAEPNENQS